MNKTPKVRIKAAAYARYSSHGQREESIEGQLRDAWEYAQKNGFDIVAEYADRAKSGTNDNREQFQRMIADSAKGQFQVVLVWKQDRFARNREESAVNKMLLKRNGVKVISVKENISEEPEGVILEGLLESLAEYYSLNLAQNIKRGRRENFLQGILSGGPVPFGYRLEKGKLLQDEINAPIVKYVFEEYAAGKSKTAIIKELKAKGIKSPKGKELNAGSYAKMLSNPAYYGKVVQAGYEVDCVPEPIISEELFLRVQEKVNARKRAPSALKAREEYLLQGKCFCGYCGASMAGESGKGKGGVIYHYYSCHTRKKLHQCTKSNEKKEILENYVVQSAVRHIQGPKTLDVIAQAVLTEYEKNTDYQKADELEKKVRRIETDLNNVVNAIAKTPEYGQARLIQRLSEMEEQKAAWEKEIARLKLSQEIRLTADDIKTWLKEFLSGDVSDPAFRKWIVDHLISAVYVYDDRIVIFYNLCGARKVTFKDAEAKMKESPQESPGGNTGVSSDQVFGFDDRRSTKAFQSRTLKGFFVCLFDIGRVCSTKPIQNRTSPD